MKLLFKGAVGTLALAAAGLTVWTAAANRRETAPLSETALDPAAAAGALAAANGATEVVTPASETSAAVPEEAPAAPIELLPAPADLKVSVKTKAGAPVLTVKRQGYLVAVRRGKERRVAMHGVEWTPKAGEPLTWETTNTKTLETARGELSWGGADGNVPVLGMVLPAVVNDDASAMHACRGHEDGAGGFVVLCRVDASAAAASLENKDPKAGVWSMAGDTTLVRFDLPMEGDGVDTKVVGYEKGGRGTIVRVEASRAPGESAALLAIGSDSRAQPQVVRRIGCVCRLPGPPDLL